MIEKQEIINYVFKDQPNPYVLDSMLTEISGEGGDSSESGKYKDAVITLINNNPESPYTYNDFLNPEIEISVSTETTIHLPVLNIPSGETVMEIYSYFTEISDQPPICTGNIEFDTISNNFIITGNGTITLTGAHNNSEI